MVQPGTKLNVFSASVDSFSLSREVKDETVLASSHFRKDEKLFHIDRMKQSHVDFCVSEKCMIYVRTIFHSITAKAKSEIQGGKKEKRKYVVCLHDMDPETDFRSSWTFVKFVQPLFNQGYDCILVDLPGFGKSAIRQNARCDPSTYRSWDEKIITQLLENMNVNIAHFICKGSSAGILFKMLIRSSHLMGRSHILVDPIIPQEDLDGMLSLENLKKAFRTAVFPRIWLTYDKNAYGNLDRQKCIYRMDRGLEILRKVTADGTMDDQLQFSEYDKGDLVKVCLSVSLGPEVPSVYAVLPSQYFKAYVVYWISAEQMLPDFKPSALRALDAVGATEEVEEIEAGAKTEDGKTLGFFAKTALVTKLKDQARTKLAKKDGPMGRKENRHDVVEDETAREKTVRLLKWTQLPEDTVMSYGVRLREAELNQQEKILHEQSLAEYEEENADEIEAIKQSWYTIEEEDNDERLQSLRQFKPEDEKEMIQQWNQAAEESLREYAFMTMSGEDQLKKAIEDSLKVDFEPSGPCDMLPTVETEEELMERILKESEETFQIQQLALQNEPEASTA